MSAAIKVRFDIESAQRMTPPPRRFTVKEYYRLAEAGIIRSDERVELIEGEILAMSPQGSKHAASVEYANRYFMSHFGNRLSVRIQSPISLNKFSEPEPDVVLAILSENNYSEHHPTPKEILLVMEIADSTLAFDRLRKSHLYAQAGIQQYALLNLLDRELEDYREPSAKGYRRKQTYTEKQSFTLAAFPQVSIKVSDLLPPLKAAKKKKRVK